MIEGVTHVAGRGIKREADAETPNMQFCERCQKHAIPLAADSQPFRQGLAIGVLSGFKHTAPTSYLIKVSEHDSNKACA